MSETLSKILYNANAANAGEAVPSEEMTYSSVLAKVQSYLSQHHSTELADTVLQEQARETVHYLLEQYLTTHKVYIAGSSIQELTDRLYRDMAGYSILEDPLADPYVEEIIANAYDDIEIVDEIGRHKSRLRFDSAEQGRDIVRRLVRLSGHTIDMAHPTVDAYITTGVRITAIFPPIVTDSEGVAFSIRKQRMGSVTRDQLLKWGSASNELLTLLELCVNYGVSICISGSTGSGKTTLLTYLLNCLRLGLRIITIEETREILIVNPRDDEGRKLKSVTSMCTRSSEDEHLNVDMQDLLRTSLRMRPNMIAMAEMRGAEALDAQEAARTGHTVTSTLHANSASQTYARIMTMCQMSGTTLTPHILMNLIVEAFPIAVFCKQMEDGKRRIMEVVEAYGAIDGTAHTRMLFKFDQQAEDDEWKRVGALSEKTAELLRSNGADEELVRYYASDPNSKARSIKKGG